MRHFLDIGTGVEALALGMVGEWPGLNVVGIEPLPGVLAQARDNVAAAGCTDRIALRVGRGEEIADTSSFDLVFVPSAFIPEHEVDLVVERGAVAFRPGGWLLLATVDSALEALPVALVRFRVATWGGTNFSDGAAEALLARCGLTDIRRVRAARACRSASSPAAGQRTAGKRPAVPKVITSYENPRAHYVRPPQGLHAPCHPRPRPRALVRHNLGRRPCRLRNHRRQRVPAPHRPIWRPSLLSPIRSQHTRCPMAPHKHRASTSSYLPVRDRSRLPF